MPTGQPDGGDTSTEMAISHLYVGKCPVDKI